MSISIVIDRIDCDFSLLCLQIFIADIKNQFCLIENGLIHLENLTEDINHGRFKESELQRFLAFETQKKHELDFLSGI